MKSLLKFFYMLRAGIVIRASHFSMSIAVVFLLSACGGDKPLSRLNSGDVVLAFGDSLTFGTGATPATSYPSVLASLTGLTVINAGIPGEKSAEGLARLPALLAKHRPALVILTHGGNDMLRRMSRDNTAENLESMIALSREAGAEVVLVGVPQPGLILATASFYVGVAEKTDTPIEKDVIADILQFPASKSDPVHPNAKGYRQMAEAIADLLRASGALD